MAKTIENLFSYLLFLFDALIIFEILVVSRAKPLSNRILWTIGFYCLLNTVCNLIQIFLGGSIMVEYISLALFTLIEGISFTYIFYLIIQNKSFKRLMGILTILFTITVIINYSFDRRHTLDSLPIGVATVLVLVYSFYYMYEQTNIVDDTFIYSRYHFWIVIGIMIYLSGSFFIYILANYVNRTILDNFWFLTYAFYILKSIFFGIGIYRLTKPGKTDKLKAFHPSLN